jgi:hypothetical protein
MHLTRGLSSRGVLRLEATARRCREGNSTHSLARRKRHLLSRLSFSPSFSPCRRHPMVRGKGVFSDAVPSPSPDSQELARWRGGEELRGACE